MKKILMFAVFLALSNCAIPPTYQAPADITPQTGASLTGIVVPMANLVSTGTHICVEAVDGAWPRYGFSRACDKPLLISSGIHNIEISADFHPFPAESGFTTVTVKLAAGQSYFIRATGGPVPFTNSNGLASLPASGLTVWIESAQGVPVVEKTMITLQQPDTVPVVVFAK
jgi:hypothetical protein